MGWHSFVDKVHEVTKYVDPGAHYGMGLAHKTSTPLVGETSNAISKLFGDTWLGNAGEHWNNMADKDKADFSRWLTNSAASALVAYGGMTGYGAMGSGSSSSSGVGTNLFGSGGTGGAMGWGDWAGIAANLGGGLLQSKGAGDAAEATRDAANAATAEQARQFNQTREDYAPWRMSGARALMALDQDIAGLPTAEEVMADPGYRFGLDQGQLALDRKIAQMGGRVSGRALKEATRYGGDYATTRYGAAYQRGQDRLNRLAAVAGIGQTATAGSAAAGMNASNAISGILMQQGEMNAASQLAKGNIWANTGNQIAALYGRPQNRNTGGNGAGYYYNQFGQPTGNGNDIYGQT